MLLSSTIHHIIVSGRLDIVDVAGKCTTFGPGSSPNFVVRLHSRRASLRIATNPQLAIGESYMTGDLTIEGGSLYDFLVFMAQNFAESGPSKLMKLREICGFLMRRFMQWNVAGRSRSNVAHHYDLTEEFYDLFLDADKQYSCAYFVESTDDIERAQERKQRHIAAKLCLRPNLRVLDIGSGWGGLAFSCTIPGRRLSGLGRGPTI